MTYTLREAIAELDAAADKYVEAMRPHVAEYMANMRGVVEKATEAEFTDAEGYALLHHLNNAIMPRVNEASKEMLK